MPPVGFAMIEAWLPFCDDRRSPGRRSYSLVLSKWALS